MVSSGHADTDIDAIVINRYLIDALEKVGLWNENILTQIKINNGSILNIDDIPADIRRRFKEVFEINPSWIIKSAALRAKWIDQAASTNIFLKTQSGKQLSDTYMLAWEHGLKTTYYLRTQAASQVQKMTDIEAIKEVAKQREKEIAEKKAEVMRQSVQQMQTLKVCGIDDEECEACQ